jgi:hypothetical protein
MPSFASVSELELHLGRTFDGAEFAAAEQSLELATAIIQAFTGQQMFPGSSVETIHSPQNFSTTGGVVVLKQRPVVDITSVEVDGDAAGFTFDPNSGIVHVSRIDPLTQTFPVWPNSIVVSYDHGYAEIPGQVKAVCLDLARQEFDNPSGYASVTIGDFSASYGRSAGGTVPTGLMLTDRHERLLAGLR